MCTSGERPMNGQVSSSTRHSTDIIESTIDRGSQLTISGIFPCARSSGERPMNGQVSSSTVGIALRI